MDIVVKYGRNMTTEEFNTLLALDVKVFGNDILVNDGLAVKRFLKFKDGIIAAYAGDRPAGFACFYSVDSTVCERAGTGGEFIDDNLCDDDVLLFSKDRENNILLFDLVVDEPFRSQGLGKKLFGLVGDFLRQKNEEGYTIGRIFGFSITEKGGRILASYGGRNIWAKDCITFFEVDRKAFLGLE